MVPDSRQSGMYNVPDLTPHVRYCVVLAVRNPAGLGPFSQEWCNTTASAREFYCLISRLSVTK